MSDPTTLTPPGRPHPGGEDRRKSVRYPCGPQTGANLGNVEGDTWPVRVRDLSAGGVSLVTRRRVEPQRLVMVDLRNKTQNVVCKVPARVIYVITPPGGDFIIGCAFTRELSAEEVQKLLSN